MRSRACLGAVAVAALVLVLPATAAQVDPRALVLTAADVPAGFRLDEGQSGVHSNNAIAKGGPDHANAVRRSGRATGYIAFWERSRPRSVLFVSSRTDLCRGAEGGRAWLAWLETRMRRANAQVGDAYARERVRLGDGGWVYSGRPRGITSLFVTVGWRHGRAVALLATDGLPRRQALALARTQQRRIAAALR